MIDPDEHMPDVNRTNNSTRKETHFHFVWDQPTYYDRDINYLPWFSYNYYNGWTPGVFAFKGLIPGYTSTTTIRPMWDLKNAKPVGAISYQHNFNSGPILNRSSVTISGAQLEGNTGGKIRYNRLINDDKSTSSISANINYSKLASGAFDTLIYSIGQYTTASINYSLIRQLEGTLKRSSFNLSLIHI